MKTRMGALWHWPGFSPSRHAWVAAWKAPSLTVTSPESYRNPNDSEKKKARAESASGLNRIYLERAT